MKLRILIVGMIFGFAAAAADTGAELFQRAVTQEQAAGNLPEAIKLYQQVAKDYASNRPLAAKALIQAARCYEKLGEDKATKLYEQVARDFSDQRDIADAARARLAVLRQQSTPVTMTARRVEPPGTPFGNLSFLSDGRRSIFRDGYALVTADGAGNYKRTIHTFKRDHDWGFSASRDFSMVLIQEGPVGGPMSIALIKSDGTGYKELGRSGARVWPSSWSWDGRSVLLIDRESDASSHLIRMTVADGRREDLLQRHGALVGSAHLSPDGRFIAFAEGAAGSARILVAPIGGGEPAVVAEDANLVDWTRDGRYLAINSGRPGARSLSLVPIKEGRSAGGPVFVRSGSVEWGMTLATGALAYQSMLPPDGSTVFIGTLGEESRVETWKPLILDSGLAQDPYPEWSPEGRQISYLSVTFEAGQPIAALRLRDLVTDADRLLYRSNAQTSQLCVWAMRRPKIFCGLGTGAGTDIVEIATDTGVAEKLAALEGVWAMQSADPDDKALFMYDMGKRRLVRWQMETHEATPLGEGLGVSPDGRFVWTGGRPTEPQSDPAIQYTLQFRSSSSSEWRRVGFFKMQPWQHPGAVHVAFSPGGEWLYYQAPDSQGKYALFRVPTAGGDSVRLGDFPSNVVEGTLRVTRDNRKVIAVAPDAAVPRYESWLLENFEPKQTAAK